MEGPVIRPMTPADYPEVYALWLRIPGMGLLTLDDSEAGITRYLERNPGLSFVALHNGALVGTILSGHDGRRGVIYHTCVAPEHRGGGLGKQLEQKALEALKAEGINKVMLMVFKNNQTGNDFWLRQGWLQRQDIHFYSMPINPDNTDIKT